MPPPSQRVGLCLQLSPFLQQMAQSQAVSPPEHICTHFPAEHTCPHPQGGVQVSGTQRPSSVQNSPAWQPPLHLTTPQVPSSCPQTLPVQSGVQQLVPAQTFPTCAHVLQMPPQPSS
jgi:hypothetical protein